VRNGSDAGSVEGLNLAGHRWRGTFKNTSWYPTLNAFIVNESKGIIIYVDDSVTSGPPSWINEQQRLFWKGIRKMLNSDKIELLRKLEKRNRRIKKWGRS